MVKRDVTRSEAPALRAMAPPVGAPRSKLTRQAVDAVAMNNDHRVYDHLVFGIRRFDFDVRYDAAHEIGRILGPHISRAQAIDPEFKARDVLVKNNASADCCRRRPICPEAPPFEVHSVGNIVAQQLQPVLEAFGIEQARFVIQAPC